MSLARTQSKRVQEENFSLNGEIAHLHDLPSKSHQVQVLSWRHKRRSSQRLQAIINLTIQVRTVK
jgi:hypothetical protein